MEFTKLEADLILMWIHQCSDGCGECEECDVREACDNLSNRSHNAGGKGPHEK